jgi:hypothetical protein
MGAIRDTPLTPVLPATHTQATRVATHTPVLRDMDSRATRDTPPTPVPRPMDTRAARHTLPTPVPVIDIPCLVIPETALRRTGRLGPSTLSSLLAELRPRIRPQCLTPLAVARANASVKSIALVRIGDPRSQQRHEDRQACQHRTFAIVSFTLAARPSRRSLRCATRQIGYAGRVPA